MFWENSEIFGELKSLKITKREIIKIKNQAGFHTSLICRCLSSYSTLWNLELEIVDRHSRLYMEER